MFAFNEISDNVWAAKLFKDTVRMEEEMSKVCAAFAQVLSSSIMTS